MKKPPQVCMWAETSEMNMLHLFVQATTCSNCLAENKNKPLNYHVQALQRKKKTMTKKTLYPKIHSTTEDRATVAVLVLGWDSVLQSCLGPVPE